MVAADKYPVKAVLWDNGARNSRNDEYLRELFTVKEVWTTAGTIHAYAFPESDSKITVYTHVNKDGSAIDDNYAVKKVCHRISAEYEEALQGISCDFVVYTGNILEIVAENNLDMTPEEYLLVHNGDRFDTAVIVGENANMAEISSRIESVEAKLPRGCSVNLFGVYDGDLEKIKRELENYDEITENVKQLIYK